MFSFYKESEIQEEGGLGEGAGGEEGEGRTDGLQNGKMPLKNPKTSSFST
jgi:hypothetical protein